MRGSFLLLVGLFLAALSLCEGISFCPEAPAVPEDRRTDKSNLRIVSFNVEWLFLERANPGWENEEEMIFHLNNIAEIIAGLNADIVVMPETEDCSVLEVMLSQAPLKGMGYKPYVLKGTDTGTFQNVAMITRIDPDVDLQRTTARADYPIFGNTCGYTGSPGTYGVSKHFFTTMTVSGKQLLLVGLHFLAFPDRTDRCVHREAQATVIRGIVEENGLAAGKEVIVLGDFNDYDPTVSDAAGNMPISRTLQIIKGLELHNVGVGYPFTDRYSAWYDINKNCIDDGGQEHTMIDHILLSPGLTMKKVEYAHVFEASCAAIKSDHWPIVVDIDTSAGAMQSIPVHHGPVTPMHASQNGGKAGSDGFMIAAVVGAVFIVVAMTVAAVAFIVAKRRAAKRTLMQPLI
eukprot:TRINITY_DN1643_c0_g1_i1.p1 TRINITY_DN1643_c0_g1~~TRINITY_DN1643_c0_g1_i1.p1  ORF type:complete len:427 (+),score=50.52 TRINITY_DN1643_c0_g1_i1:73-1281(+)